MERLKQWVAEKLSRIEWVREHVLSTAGVAIEHEETGKILICGSVCGIVQMEAFTGMPMSIGGGLLLHITEDRG